MGLWSILDFLILFSQTWAHLEALTASLDLRSVANLQHAHLNVFQLPVDLQRHKDTQLSPEWPQTLKRRDLLIRLTGFSSNSLAMLVDVTLFSVPLVLAVDALCQHSVHCAILMLSLFTAAGSEAEFTTSRWNGLRDTSRSMFDEEDGTFEEDSWSSWRRSSDCSRLKLLVRPDVYSCACYLCSISEKTWLSYFWYMLIDYKQHNISVGLNEACILMVALMVVTPDHCHRNWVWQCLQM